MTILDCPNCGGIHYGSLKCPFRPAEPCTICGVKTILCCSDCAIDTARSVHVCEDTKCRDAHEAVGHQQQARSELDEAKQRAEKRFKDLGWDQQNTTEPK